MSHVIPSPVAMWPGSVTVPDYFNYPQYRAWKEGVTAARALLEAARPENGGTGDYDDHEYRRQFAVGICGVVEAWELAGLPLAMTPDLFPQMPNDSAVALFNWLARALTEIASEVDGQDPKSPAPSSAG